MIVDKTNNDTKLYLRITRNLRQRFKIECTKRDVSMSYMIKDYIRKQLRHWEEQEKKLKF